MGDFPRECAGNDGRNGVDVGELREGAPVETSRAEKLVDTSVLGEQIRMTECVKKKIKGRIWQNF